MWKTKETKSSISKKSPPKSQTFHGYVRQKREDLQTEVDNVALLEEQHRNLLGAITNLPNCRSSIRTRKDLQLQADALQKRIVDHKSGRSLQLLDETIAPFLEAHQHHQNVVSMKILRSEVIMNKDGTLLEELQSELEGTTKSVTVVSGDCCENCGQTMIVVTQNCFMICPSCHHAEPFLDVTPASMPYGDDVEMGYFNYKRIGRFKEWITFFQAKENTQVPTEILEKLSEYFASMNMSVDDITKHNVRDALKILKLGRNGIYEHLQQIFSRLTGKPPPRLSMRQENHLLVLFQKIQSSWAKHKPPNRSNFLSYPYVLYKFCELLGWHEYLECFPLLTGEPHRRKQDTVWKKICEDQGWPFKETILKQPRSRKSKI